MNEKIFILLTAAAVTAVLAYLGVIPKVIEFDRYVPSRACRLR